MLCKPLVAGLNTYRLSYSDLVTLVVECGAHVSHTTIMRWVLRYVPEYGRRWNRRATPVRSCRRGTRRSAGLGQRLDSCTARLKAPGNANASVLPLGHVSTLGRYSRDRRPNVQATAADAVLIFGGTRNRYDRTLPSGSGVELVTSTMTRSASSARFFRQSFPRSS